MSCSSLSNSGIPAVTDGNMVRRKLPLGVVDLWFTSLRGLDFSLAPLLSRDELNRASRFRFDRDAADFVGRRGILRILLAAYTGTPPSQLLFTYNKAGKPFLDGRFSGIRFSLSQSNNLVIYALARENIGVDLENFRKTNLEMRAIADSFFSTKQIDVLSRAPHKRKPRIFLRQWTLLEAIGKARGIGICKLDSDANAFSGKSFRFRYPAQSPRYIASVAIESGRRSSPRAMQIQLHSAPAGNWSDLCKYCPTPQIWKTRFEPLTSA